VAIGAACAALALVLTLLVAGTLNDVWSVSTSGSPPAASPGVRATSTQPGWNLRPLTHLLRAPVGSVWSAGA
jgi:hypothetical protein